MTIFAITFGSIMTAYLAKEILFSEQVRSDRPSESGYLPGRRGSIAEDPHTSGA